MLNQALKCDNEGDALTLAKAAKIVRKDIFSFEVFKFNASFPSACQGDSVPETHKSLVAMLLNGSNLRDQDSSDTQTCLADHIA